MYPTEPIQLSHLLRLANEKQLEYGLLQTHDRWIGTDDDGKMTGCCPNFAVYMYLENLSPEDIMAARRADIYGVSYRDIVIGCLKKVNLKQPEDFNDIPGILVEVDINNHPAALRFSPSGIVSYITRLNDVWIKPGVYYTFEQIITIIEREVVV